jgi:hypothetical protein
MVQFHTPDGEEYTPAAALPEPPFTQPKPPPRYSPSVEDAQRAIQRGGAVNLHSLTCFMITEGNPGGGGRPHYRGIVFSRDGRWEAMQWNGILRGGYLTRDEAIAALLHPVGR